MDYHVLDGLVTVTTTELETILNAEGANGWRLVQHFITQYQHRRSIFKKVQGVVEYLVTETATGRTAEEAEAVLDMHGADGWELNTVYVISQNRRRSIYMRGATNGGPPSTGNGGIPEAPLDHITYGRLDAAWNPALAHDNDVLDGGNF